MEGELLKLINDYPKVVKWNDVVDFDCFDERLSAIDCLVINTIGVCDGEIEFIPDNNPPLKEEVFCWIWGIRPDLSAEFLKINISEDFRILLNSYLNSKMEEFWNHMC